MWDTTPAPCAAPWIHNFIYFFKMFHFALMEHLIPEALRVFGKGTEAGIQLEFVLREPEAGSEPSSALLGDTS